MTKAEAIMEKLAAFTNAENTAHIAKAVKNIASKNTATVTNTLTQGSKTTDWAANLGKKVDLYTRK